MRRVLLLIIVVAAIASITSFLLVKNKIYKEEKYNMETETTDTTNEISGDVEFDEEEQLYDKSYNFNYEFSEHSKNNSVINNTTWKINPECVADRNYDDFHRNMIRFEFKDNICTFYGFGSFSFSGRYYIKEYNIYINFTKYEAVISPEQNINEYATLKLNDMTNLSIIEFPESIYVQMHDYSSGHSGELKYDYRGNEIEKGYVFTNTKQDNNAEQQDESSNDVNSNDRYIDLRTLDGVDKNDWQGDIEFKSFSREQSTIELTWNNQAQIYNISIEDKGRLQDDRFIKYNIKLYDNTNFSKEFSTSLWDEADPYETISIGTVNFDKEYLIVKIEDEWVEDYKYYFFDETFNLILEIDQSYMFYIFGFANRTDTSKVGYIASSFKLTKDCIYLNNCYNGIRVPEYKKSEGYSNLRIRFENGKPNIETINTYTSEDYELYIGMD